MAIRASVSPRGHVVLLEVRFRFDHRCSLSYVPRQLLVHMSACTCDALALRFRRVTGYAYFKDIARGRLSGGDAAGFLKLVSRADEPTRHVVIGVQIIGGLDCR